MDHVLTQQSTISFFERCHTAGTSSEFSEGVEKKKHFGLESLRAQNRAQAKEA
jgi:hypothetical protein